jgi:hypothetical protein
MKMHPKLEKILKVKNSRVSGKAAMILKLYAEYLVETDTGMGAEDESWIVLRKALTKATITGGSTNIPHGFSAILKAEIQNIKNKEEAKKYSPQAKEVAATIEGGGFGCRKESVYKLMEAVLKEELPRKEKEEGEEEEETDEDILFYDSIEK